MTVSADEILKRLGEMASAENIAGMARYGIRPAKAFGVSSAEVKKIAKEIGKNHALAQQLWRTGFHEARFLACLIDNPSEVTAAQMEAWAADFDSWALCDSCCGHLFDRTKFAYQKAFEWSEREEEFVKRAAFALMAWLAVHDKKADDGIFLEFLNAIEQNASDERNFIRKAVNWALRHIGKRNAMLNRAAIETSNRIKQQNSKAARWIVSDALRELFSDKVQNRLK